MKVMIEGAEVKRLKIIADDRGFLMEMLRADDPLFKKFGQVYMTTCKPGIVKGWHYHKKQTDNLVVVKGMAKVVLCDYRKDSKTYKEINEFVIGEKNPMLIKIPPIVLHGFTTVGKEMAYLINIPTETYNYEKPDEYRIPPDSSEVVYDWGNYDKRKSK